MHIVRAICCYVLSLRTPDLRHISVALQPFAFARPPSNRPYFIQSVPVATLGQHKLISV